MKTFELPSVAKPGCKRTSVGQTIMPLDNDWAATTTIGGSTTSAVSGTRSVLLAAGTQTTNDCRPVQGLAPPRC